MDFVGFIAEHKFIILFYFIIILIIIIKRKKFEFQAKFIALYKTRIGIPFMEKFGDRHRELLKILGYCGIGLGFTGMVVITVFIVRGLYSLLFIPDAAPTLSLVIPGVKIPGSPVFVPFWYGIIALFIVVLIHEASHGLIARAYKIPLKSTGIVFFGPLIGAFVEPDEKELKKHSDIVQYSIFAAGPFSNIILAVVVGALLLLVFQPLKASMVTETGFSFSTIQEDYPAAAAGVQPETNYDRINGEPVTSALSFIDSLTCIQENQNVTIGNENVTYTILTTEHPDNPGQGYLGVQGIQTSYELKDPSGGSKFLFFILQWIEGLFEWVIILSLGIGLANLLPLGPVDGGRMFQTALVNVNGKEKGMKWWGRISIVFLIVIIVLILVPIIKALL